MRPTLPVSLALPMTPMLDMSFQLLAFFLFLFRPAAAEGQLAIMLPSDSVGQQNPKADEFPAAIDEYRVIIRSSPTGGFGTISLIGPANVKENIRTIDALSAELNLIRKPARQGAAVVSITIQPTNDLQYARLIDVLDACKRVGFDNLKLGPMPTGRM
jgi:biopolymer transport protein ExbD